MSFLNAQAGRAFVTDLTLKDADGDTVTPGSSDVVRVAIGRAGAVEADLDGAALIVSSDAATSAGSTLQKNTPTDGKNRLTIVTADLAFTPGTYTFFVDFYDAATALWRTVSREVFTLGGPP